MFEFTFDESDGVLRAETRGVWTVHTVDQYLDSLLLHADHARRSTGKLRLIVNAGASELPVHARERLREVERSVLSSTDDRIAIILKSSLDKIHIKSVSSSDRVATFLSPDAAHTWLLAYD